MKEQSFSEEVQRILGEAPSAQDTLRANYSNLLTVAEYCYDNYITSGDGSLKALEETKNFATQSLASVAYQISSLANSVLSLLDAQTNQLLHMESSINLVGQMVEMHKEKVSRREIGVFTSVRRVSRNQKVLPPSRVKPRPTYSRRPINYQQLDCVGHGVKVTAGKQVDRKGTIRKQGTSTRNTKAEPVLCPVAPPAGSSSFGKPVAPPTISPLEWDIISTQLPEAPPPPTNDKTDQDDKELGSLGGPGAPPSSPGPAALTNDSVPPVSLPLPLETVLEENPFPMPSPPPPPPSDNDNFSLVTNDAPDLLTNAPPPPPPPPTQEGEALSPTTRSLSLRVRSGPVSRQRLTRSLFLPAVQSLMIPPPPSFPPPSAPPSCPRPCVLARLQHLDLEIPAPPPPPTLLDDEEDLEDITNLPPPPLEDEGDAATQYVDKGCPGLH